jgi:hypothetical protein
MSKSERFKALLQSGYFPEELPPPFNTLDLAKFRSFVASEWKKVNGGKYPRSTFETYSNPRVKRVRRNLALVNPVAQLVLAKLIADNWITLRKALRDSDYSIQVPEIESDKEKAVSPPDFQLVGIRRLEISAAFDHALVSDISRFYGTLYTHAIPWALHGKAWSKSNLHATSFATSLGNQLDIAVRRGQDNQTLGIPVGPDTSRIISEIVAVAIDKQVQDKLKLDRTRAFRHIDDWYIGFDNAGQAEDAVSTLAAACRDYELELNADKTRTLSSSSSVDGIWPTELRAHQFSVGAAQAKSLEHYFAKAFHYSLEFQDQNVLDYAIKRTKSTTISKPNWRLYESFLLRAGRSNSTVVPTVAQILVSYNHNGYDIDKPRVAKFIEDLIRKNAPLAHHAEVAWALFLAKALRIKISKAASASVSGIESSVCALIALDLNSNGLIDGTLDTTLWRQSMNSSGLLSKMWLLSYEADLKGWLVGTPVDYVAKDQHFSVLKAKSISFYDTKKNVTHIRKEKPKAPSKAVADFLAHAGMAQKWFTQIASTYYG